MKKMNIPNSKILPINHLSSIFKDTTNSYKFYWFIAILEDIKQKSENRIPSSRLIARMIANIWYPINYFRISFGKQDRLGRIALQVKKELNLKISEKYQKVFKEVLNILKYQDNSIQDLNSLLLYVPYRFLRPWFRGELNGFADHKINSQITELAEKNFDNINNLPMYQLLNKDELYIRIQSYWFDYLQKHNKILFDYCYWNLLIYLQKRNPNVPNIAQKLFPPRFRRLIKARNFWDIAISENIISKCIYSDLKIDKNDYSIDHFIPWSFVTHDQLWNLIPVPKPVNSSKSDSIPYLNKYFERFSITQHSAFKIIYERNKRNLLEDYTVLFNADYEEIFDMNFSKFSNKLYETLIPLVQIAENMGFPSNWVYK